MKHRHKPASIKKSKRQQMNQMRIPIAVVGASKERKRALPRGRTVDPQALAQVQELLGNASRQADMLIEHLHKIQDRYGCLSAQHLAALAKEMRMAQTEVYEVATFYHHFDVVKDGNDVRVIAAPCVGRCEQAPVAVVGQHPVPHATCESVAAKVGAKELMHVPEPYLDYDDYVAQGGYALLKECLSGKREIDSVIKSMEDSGLRGLGGAGFPAGRNWRIVRAEAGPRLMAVNIDEGEPGTFKDRYYLERDPHRFQEGMQIAAWTVGNETNNNKQHDEYHGCRALLEAELEKLRANPPMADLPAIQLRRGAGAYICGEESAMIESIEGKRGMPRLRPPYVAQVGLFGRPTLEHNFETLYWVREILEKGGAWFSSQGANGRKGLRSFSVSGCVLVLGVLFALVGSTIQE